MIVSTTLFEIPTGAIGDLLGKKKTLMLAFFINGISQIWMGFAPNLLHMALSLVSMNLGGALVSGTFEAMIYDSLKQDGKENQYNKVISRMTSVNLVSTALCGVIGGFLYAIWHGLPFVACGVLIFIACFLSSYLVEPLVDSEKFTFKNFVAQNVQGFKQLFGTIDIARLTIGLLLIMFVSLIVHEGINDMLGIVYGFNEVQLGFLAAGLSLLGAGASLAASKLRNVFESRSIMLVGIALYVVSLLVAPYVTFLLGAATLAIRSMISPIFDNEVSTQLNSMVESKYRATVLSTFSMLKGIPYALSIYGIGLLADVYPVPKIAFILGVFLIGVGIYNAFVIKPNPQLRG